MTTPNKLEEAIETAAKAFQGASTLDEREKGFESTELPAEEVQMRKGCRALTLARELLPNGIPDDLTHKRYYTAAIELSFNVVERSCQAALIHAGHLQEEEIRPHTEILEQSHRAGYWGVQAAQGLATLYEGNRSKFYYGDGVPSETRAKRMLEVAQQLPAIWQTRTPRWETPVSAITDHGSPLSERVSVTGDRRSSYQ